MRYRALIACCFVVACVSSPKADEPVAFASPADLWQGYDPAALPLDVEILSTWQEGEASFQKLHFTAEEVAGGRVRVFAIAGWPTEMAPRAGILHIHGGGQTASIDWVRFWTQRGYACVTYDFCGAWQNRTEVTDWGPLEQGNMAKAAGGFQVSPTPRASSWYHWTLVARRALTLLAGQPGVDRERLGIFGISVGGTLCWSVAGSDSRVKTAVPIYGCGYNSDARRTRWGFPPLTAELALFQRVVSPEAHAPYITCPILFLNSTNDFHGWMDSSYDILPATTGPRWQAYTPRQNHHIAPDQGRDLPAWMDYQLRGGPAFPASSTVALKIGATGTPQATVATGASPAERVDVYYSLNDKPPPNRSWRRVPATHAESAWRAELPVLDAWQPVFAFANVYYPSGVCLTTNLERRTPGMLGKARATLRPGDSLSPRSVAESWFYARSYTDPNSDKTLLTIEDQSDRAAVVSMNPAVFGESIAIDLSSHIVGDPQFAGSAGQVLAFDCRGDLDPQGLRVTVTHNDWTPLSQSYSATIPAAEVKQEWTTIELPLARFKLKDADKAPERWQDLDKINLQGTTSRAHPFAIANLRWLPAPAAK